MRYSYYILIFILVTVSSKLNAQIVINEVSSYNGSVISDENNKIHDWIELYNNSTSTVALYNFSLENRVGEKWYFPNCYFPAKSFLLIFASGESKNGSVLHTSFKLSKLGEDVKLFDDNNVLINEITIGSMQLNHSIGRFPDASNSIYIFDVPTPCFSNNNSKAYKRYADNPVFSYDNGFYSSSILLKITNNNSNSILYFTSDGSNPDTTSNKYVAPFQIDSSIVIKARMYSNDITILPSEEICKTYFMNYKSTLPVFSISTKPYNLWDWNHGIYVLGPNADTFYPYHGANFWQEWEIPAHIQFYESNQKLIIEQDAGLSINGGSVSRTRPQQSLRITSRNKYGDNDLSYRFFEEKNIKSFDNIVLRNSSLDFNITQFRDGSLHKLMLIGKLNIDLLCYRPSVVFLNGKYWGVQNIRERFSKHYIEENYHINADNVDLLEEDTAIIEGNFDAFNKMQSFIHNSDMSLTFNYDSAKVMLDVESLCDYYIAETFLTNTDWPYNNLKYWKSHNPETKWRYMLMDLDVSLGCFGWAPANMDLLGRIMGSYGDTNKHVQILKSLLRNTDFRTYFINRYCDLVNTVFSSENMKQHIEKIKKTLEPEMPFHFNRWGSSIGAWYWEIDNVVIPFIEAKPSYALQFVQDTFMMNKKIELELKVYPPEAGLIKINTITPSPFPWKGTYFDGNPITATAIEHPGYRFVKWQSNKLIINSFNKNSFTANLDSNTTLIAVFEQFLTNHQLNIFPNPATNIIKLDFLEETNSSITFNIYDCYGKVAKSIMYTGNVGLNETEIYIADLKIGIYIVKMQSDTETRIAKFVVN